ncbi:MAG: tRNA (adenosine(37)-N6)-threonylcarbamoyltransferase complex dimerization subunit type 1 TsaB [Clostridia bacterium]|nr:tRNA (adenosine(37)-N6)-threonylcarbamoyltransferase complex dimerization subunit type 1 TsaB [Clostridia bacterium]
MLAINTAFMTANLALRTAVGKVVLKDIDAKSKHSENVLKSIDEMCQEASTEVLDVGTVAVVVGPGSFTGLRIGVAIAKALGCAGKDLKFVSLSSLQLMAYKIAKSKLNGGAFVCVINALSDLFFVAQFDVDGKIVGEEKMISKEEYQQIDIEKFALAGDVQTSDVKEMKIDCKDLLDFALEKEEQGDFVLPDDLNPSYLRLSQAEDMLAQKARKDC